MHPYTLAASAQYTHITPLPFCIYALSVESKRKVGREGMKGVESWEWKMIDPF